MKVNKTPLGSQDLESPPPTLQQSSSKFSKSQSTLQTPQTQKSSASLKFMKMGSIGLLPFNEKNQHISEVFENSFSQSNTAPQKVHITKTPTIKSSRNHHMLPPRAKPPGISIGRLFSQAPLKVATGGQQNCSFQTSTHTQPKSSTGGAQEEVLPAQAQKTEKQSLALYDHQKRLGQSSNLILMKYKKKIRVEGHGEYEIEVTNVVNANTMQMMPLIPSLMSQENLQQSQQYALKQAILAQTDQRALIRQPKFPKSKSRAEIVAEKQKEDKQRLPLVLRCILKSELLKKFRQFKFGSRTYHRDRETFRAMKIVQMVSIINQRLILNKTLAFQWISIKADNSQRTLTQNTSQPMQIEKFKISIDRSFTGKAKKKIFNKINSRLQDVLSVAFHRWKFSAIVYENVQNKQQTHKEPDLIDVMSYEWESKIKKGKVLKNDQTNNFQIIPQDISAIHDDNMTLMMADDQIDFNYTIMPQDQKSSDEFNLDQIHDELRNMLQSLKEDQNWNAIEDAQQPEMQMLQIENQVSEIEYNRLMLSGMVKEENDSDKKSFRSEDSDCDNWCDRLIPKGKRILGLNDSREHDFDDV